MALASLRRSSRSSSLMRRRLALVSRWLARASLGSAQPLMVIVPNDYSAEVEAVLENRDVGFVKQGQRAEIKIETFPFTRYGTIPAEVSFISNDAVADEQRGLVFPVRLKLARSTLQVDERTVNLAAGMAVTAEIKTGYRRVIEYFLSPLLQTMDESLGEQ